MNILLQIICIILFIEPLKGTNNYSNRNCKSCKHFVKPFMNEDIYIGDYFGKCRKFFKINYGTNELQYEFAALARLDNLKCGLKGRYFVVNSNMTKNYDDFPI